MLWGWRPSMIWTLVTPSSMACTQQSTLGIMPPAMVPWSFSPWTSAARMPIVMDKGEGCYVWDLDGRKFLDFVG